MKNSTVFLSLKLTIIKCQKADGTSPKIKTKIWLFVINIFLVSDNTSDCQQLIIGEGEFGLSAFTWKNMSGLEFSLLTTVNPWSCASTCSVQKQNQYYKIVHCVVYTRDKDCRKSLNATWQGGQIYAGMNLSVQPPLGQETVERDQKNRRNGAENCESSDVRFEDRYAVTGKLVAEGNAVGRTQKFECRHQGNEKLDCQADEESGPEVAQLLNTFPWTDRHAVKHCLLLRTCSSSVAWVESMMIVYSVSPGGDPVMVEEVPVDSEEPVQLL